MMNLLKAAVALPILASTVANAQSCPVFDDLDAGVRVRLSSGTYSDIVRELNGTITVRNHTDDGKLYDKFEYVQHVLEANYSKYEETDLFPSYAIEFYYYFDSPVDTRPNGYFDGFQYEKDSYGDHYESRYEIDFSSTKSMSIGQCKYDYLTVRKRYSWPDDSDEAFEMYLPALGLLLDINPTIPFNLRLLEEGSINRS